MKKCNQNSNKGNYLIGVFLALIFSSSSAFGQLIITSPESQLMGKSLTYYADYTDTMSYQNVLGHLDEFELNTDEIFTDIARSCTYWFHFTVTNRTDKDLWIDINNTNLTDIRFHKFDSSYRLKEMYHTGALMPDSTKLTEVSTFQFPLLDADEKQAHHYLIGLKTLLTYEVPIYVGDYAAISETRMRFDFGSVFFIGAVLLMLLYNLFIYLVTFDRIYLYYVAYLVPVALVSTYLNNFPIIACVIGKQIAYTYLDTWLWTIFAGTGLFTIVYFELKKYTPVFYWVLIGQIAIFIFAGILNLFIPLSEIANYYEVLAIIFYTTCLVLGYYLLIKGVKRAWLYCIGWTAMIAGAIMYLLVYNGLLPYNAFFRNISYFGALFEILVFSIALGQRINKLRIKELALNKRLIGKNNELTNLNESLDSFNYHVSHDLKTVINNTRALTLMAEKYNAIGDQNKINEILDRLKSVNDNAAETVQSFLSLGRVEHIFKEKNHTKINLADSLIQTLKLHNLTAKIDVEIQKDQIFEMRMHEKAFESIFLNLFTNTIKYSDGRPKAQIRFLSYSNKYAFRYKDFGVGIDMEKYGERLFKPFQRANESPKKEGTGVGLYLIKKIVENYGGEVKIQSELGQGTLFIMEFPKK